MQTWEELRQLSDAELGKTDLATMNVACAVGLPGADDAALAFGRLLTRLDELTERARAAQALVNPNGKSVAYYQVQRLVEVLRDAVLTSGSVSAGNFLADDQGEDVLMLDLLRGTSCSRSAFLVLCVAIGRRLGYPLQLLAARAEKFFYLFGRWDDGKGESFNIDVGAEGMCSRPDEYYRTGPYYVAPRPVKDSRLLTPLKPQEELAFFLGGRGFKWEAAGDHRKALDAFAWASAINPRNWGLRHILTLAIRRWRAKLNPRVPPGFPELTIAVQSRRYPMDLMFEQEQAILHAETVEMLLNDPSNENEFWEPMRKGWPRVLKLAAIHVTHTPTGARVKMLLQPGAPKAEQDRWAPPKKESPPSVAGPANDVSAGPLTIERLIGMPKGELAKVDLAEMNLVCARGLPGAVDLDIAANLRKIAEWVEYIRDITQRASGRFETHPEVYDNSRATFRVVTMVLILQRNLGMRYNEERKNNITGDDFFNRAEDIFIHGIVSGSGGTCCSVPVLCVAVGRRLGYPLTLVHTARHQFFRWEEPGGERINLNRRTIWD